VGAAADLSSRGLDWLAGPLAFLVTDIDDLVVLVAFFADAAVRPHDVVLGQYAGITFLLAASALAMLARLVIPLHLVGLLGVLPIALGIREAVEAARARRAANDEPESVRCAEGPRSGLPTAGRRVGVLGVALVTVANGGDNVAVYAPLFASATPARAAGLAGIFLVMTGLWLSLAWFTVRNPLFGRHVSRWGRFLLPPVLVVLGAWIMWENGTLAWLAGRAAGLFGR
jgi:cadmium resistance protein CadD (predicted permease)